MSPRQYLVGPVGGALAEQFLYEQRQSGRCLAFNHDDDVDLVIGAAETWADVRERLPVGWEPDFLVLDLAYKHVPAGLWSAPAPIVALAEDWSLLWHQYRRRLSQCELVLTDAGGAERLQAVGFDHVRAVNLFGCERMHAESQWPQVERDIDILFVGSMHAHLQRERMPWLARVARQSGHRRVLVRDAGSRDEQRRLLARSRVAFEHSLRGECSRRVFESAAAGAVFFIEEGNREVAAQLEPGRECVCYNEDNLETLLEHYLTHEEERLAIARAAWARVRNAPFERLWQEELDWIDSIWPELVERAGRRSPAPAAEELLTRTSEMLGCLAGADHALFRDLRDELEKEPTSALHSAMGLVVTHVNQRGGPVTMALAQTAHEHFERAWASDPVNVIAGLNLLETLVGLEERDRAIDHAHKLLAILDWRQRHQPAQPPDGDHFPPIFDLFRVEWERAGWAHIGKQGREAEAKHQLITWRVRLILAELTGDLVHYYEACAARPDLPLSQAALGCALARAKRPGDAVGHLQQALESNPFDRDAAFSLHHVLGDLGDRVGQERLAQSRRLLSLAAGKLVPVEDWFSAATPAGPIETADRPRVSLAMIVKNEQDNLPACLESVAGLFEDIVIVDTGSTDRTKQIAAQHGARVFDFPWVDDFAAARNECIQHAAGSWIFWLDADDRLGEANRHKLQELLASLKNENVAYVMKCECLSEQSGAATVVDHVRLFRNHPDMRWKYRVHEQILPALRAMGGDVRWSDVVIQHVGYQDLTLRRSKLERDLRLLHIENDETPNDPFTLFNLGSVYNELGQVAEALPALRRSLELSHPADSIVRKLYALLSQCHKRLGERELAGAACRKGLEFYPDDIELLFLNGQLHFEAGDDAGAAAAWSRLLEKRDAAHFASVDGGLVGYKTRHNLAVICFRQRKIAEAEEHWRRCLAEQPDFAPALVGLGELLVTQERWTELEPITARLEEGAGPMESALLRARAHLGRAEFDDAREILEGACKRAPAAGLPRRLLSYTLLKEGKDPARAEETLRELLDLEPQDEEAQHNLQLLLEEQGR